MMPYDEALKAWGAQRIDANRARSAQPCDPETVTVEFVHESDGCETCGYDYAEVRIKGDAGEVTIDPEDFDFGQVLREIVAAAGGSVTLDSP